MKTIDELVELQQCKQMYDYACEQVDLVFQSRSDGPPPILPDFARPGENKFKLVVDLAKAYRSMKIQFDPMKDSAERLANSVEEYQKRLGETSRELSHIRSEVGRLSSSLFDAARRITALQKTELEMRLAIENIRDAVLNERGPLAEAGLDCDQINAVLAVIDDMTPHPTDAAT